MREKTRTIETLDYALPAAQVALAVALLWWDRALFFASMRRCDAPGPSPGFTVLLAISAPVRLLQEVWRNYIYTIYAWNNAVPWDSAALIVAVGLLWHWVALNIRSWRRRRAVLVFSWRPAISLRYFPGYLRRRIY